MVLDPIWRAIASRAPEPAGARFHRVPQTSASLQTRASATHPIINSNIKKLCKFGVQLQIYIRCT